MNNPFDQSTDVQPADVVSTDTSTTEVPEVDIPTPEALADETDMPASAGEGVVPKPVTPKAAPAKATAPKKTLPDGYVMPVAFARALTEHLAAKGASNKHGLVSTTNPIPPQFIYSVIKNSQRTGTKNPLPTYEIDGQSNLIKLEEGLAWWDTKDERVAASKVANATKAAAKAAKAAEKPATPEAVPAGAVVEAE